jgi:hypothetical protein
MFRKTTITITLAAAAFVAVGSAPAPAEAFDPFEDWDCIVEPLHCIYDEATPDRDRGPVEEETTLDPGAIAGTIDVDLGGILFPDSESPSLTPGGVSTDVSPGTVTTPELPEDVLDAITEPSVELPPVEVPAFEAPESTEPPADVPPAPEAPEAPSAPAPEAPSASATTETPAATSRTERPGPATVAPEHVNASRSVSSETVTPDPSSNTSVPSQDDANDDQEDESVEAFIETAVATDTGGSVDPMMAALLGMLGALALTLVVFAAFTAGRRRN